jgi:hypothetical protein
MPTSAIEEGSGTAVTEELSTIKRNPWGEGLGVVLLTSNTNVLMSDTNPELTVSGPESV